MMKNSAITIAYTAGITALLMLIFPKFNNDLKIMWYHITNGGSVGLDLSYFNSGNFFPIFLGICGAGTAFLMWWHNRPQGKS